jgi:hypothetical protein
MMHLCPYVDLAYIRLVLHRYKAATVTTFNPLNTKVARPTPPLALLRAMILEYPS